MIEKIRFWKITYRAKNKNKTIVIQVRDGLIYDYYGEMIGFKKKQILGWNICSVLRTMFNEYRIIEMYRMKDGKYTKLNKEKIEKIVREPVSS